ncbi:MAG: hypothetical protein A2Z88_01865 [Omnitrophica WOR_2 bacterium GWA2_47_8]|nr:MAG: hypothetical protein A2Z88_01865 [Omnitrophica WOR_2 bacterium GWA2_47_8]
MHDFLEKILKEKREYIQQKQPYYNSIRKKVADEKFTRYNLFKNAISKPGQINLIAEIKKASPSRGLIRDTFDVSSIADIYVKNGAAAISILTEEKYFLGKPPYVQRVSEHFSVPVLTKDFILEEGQIFETFAFGTSAVLLIVAILTDEQLKHLLRVAADLDLDCLVEVHDEKELERALKAGANIIGINNRNLHTFEVDLKVSERLIPKIPKGKVIVVESGFTAHEEVVRMKEIGSHAVLIGETFMKAPDIGQKIQEVMHGK